jgi:hypothetical protein
MMGEWACLSQEIVGMVGCMEVKNALAGNGLGILEYGSLLQDHPRN